MEAEPEDLWDTFDYVLYDADNLIEDDITINNYMDLWTKQPGYPLITVKSANNGSVVASQVMKIQKKIQKYHTPHFHVLPCCNNIIDLYVYRLYNVLSC
jgi:aminopeptidase N